MNQNEELGIRLKMVEMHDFFLAKIDEAVEAENYFEASWLVYSCLENRFFRVLDKYKRSCKYCRPGGKCRKGSNQLAISTKISCVERLCAAGVTCISTSFDEELFQETRGWIKRRNRLMHDLLSLEHYEEHFDTDFKSLATEGVALNKKIYSACTAFRDAFFNSEYEFSFPEECMERCPCKPRDNPSKES